jgi:hypothetical protein
MISVDAAVFSGGVFAVSDLGLIARKLGLVQVEPKH